MIKANPMVHRLALTKARVNLGQVVKRVHVNKEYFILEKDGIPVAGIMGADELEDYLELQDPKVRDHIRKLEGVPGEGQYRLSLGRWRFRYDISGQRVELYYCGLRREDTY